MGIYEERFDTLEPAIGYPLLKKMKIDRKRQRISFAAHAIFTVAPSKEYILVETSSCPPCAQLYIFDHPSPYDLRRIIDQFWKLYTGGKNLAEYIEALEMSWKEQARTFRILQDTVQHAGYELEDFAGMTEDDAVAALRKKYTFYSFKELRKLARRIKKIAA